MWRKKRKEMLAIKRANRTEKRITKKEKKKETFKNIGQGLKNVGESLWLGETSKQKEERLASEAQSSDSLMNILLLTGVGAVVIFGIIVIMKRG